jgi:glycosyltransferase involved in cell wall biosynthesis
VYQRLSNMSYIGALLKQQYGIPFVCEYNGSIPWMSRHWTRKPLKFEKLALRAERASLMAADLVVVVTEENRDDLIAMGIPAERILVNPNGVDPLVFHPGMSGDAVSARFGLDGKHVFGFIGTFGPWHGAETLVQAFAIMLKRRPDLAPRVRLMMIGEGVRRSSAETIAHEQGIASSVVFTGAVPQADAPSYLAACHTLVSPHVLTPDGSPFFGSPTKLFEYMAMGRGIVASDLNQIGRILQDGVTAVLVKAGDANQLAEAMARMADDPTLGARLGQAAREVVEAQYTWRAHTLNILDALSEKLDAA